MGIIVRPDGSFEAENVADALALSAALRKLGGAGRPNGKAESGFGRSVEIDVARSKAARPGRLEALERKAAEAKPPVSPVQATRALALVEALDNVAALSGSELARLWGVKEGKGLGSVIGQVNTAIKVLAGMPADQVVHRVRDRKEGVTISRGPRFAVGLQAMKAGE